jgi:hypothetical protein
MAESRATAILKEPNGRKFRKSARGADNAAAAAALARAIALTGGEVVSVTISDPAEVLTGYTPATGTYSDGNFTFNNAGITYNVHFEQLGNGFAAVDADGNETGYIDITNAVVLAWAGDHDGTLVMGKYGK